MRNKLRLWWLSPEHAYTNKVVQKIADSLPHFVNDARRQQLPTIVREWARWQIDAERNVVDPKSETPLARANLTKVSKLSVQLSEHLTDIDYAAEWTLAWIASGRPLHREPNSDPFLKSGHLAVARVQASLELLHEWADQAIKILPKTVGRYRNISRETVLAELAEMFEFLSGQRAARRVRGKDHAEHGKDYGPFWDFAVAMWLPIYGSKRGLGDLMKRWAFHRSRGQTSSKIIEAMRRDHPEWEI